MKRTILAACAGAMLLTATAAFADIKEKGNDARPVVSAKVSLESAISIAEKYVNSKAVRAEYEKQKYSTWVCNVEVRAGDAVTDVKVDADKGTVIASKADAADSDDDDDKAD